MRSALTALAGLLLAAAGTVVLASALPRLQSSLDLFLIATVYFAITRARPAGIVCGAAAGLLEDVFASHLLGFQAFVKTGVAYLVGSLGSRFMLGQPVPQVLALLLATGLDGVIAALLSFMIGRPVGFGPGLLGQRALVNSVVGLIIYTVAGSLGSRRR